VTDCGLPSLSLPKIQRHAGLGAFIGLIANGENCLLLALEIGILHLRHFKIVPAVPSRYSRLRKTAQTIKTIIVIVVLVIFMVIVLLFLIKLLY